MKILESLIEFINDRPELKILEIAIAKDFSKDALSRHFLRTYSALKQLIDSRELEVTVKLISIRSPLDSQRLDSKSRSSSPQRPRDKRGQASWLNVEGERRASNSSHNPFGSALKSEA